MSDTLRDQAEALARAESDRADEIRVLEAKLGVALTILSDNDPDGDLLVAYFARTTADALRVAS